ncbi:MAG: HEAT repeat domain-containing protein [Alkalispirochaeta sp.]
MNRHIRPVFPRRGLLFVVFGMVLALHGALRAEEAVTDPRLIGTTLTVVDSGVTPGTITVPPTLISYMTTRSETGEGPRERSAIALATEDRRLRLLGPDGSEIAAVRTGVRSPIAIFPVGTGILRLLRPDGADILAGFNGARGVTATAGDSEDGTPSRYDRSVIGDILAVYPDAEENSYLLYPPGQIEYRSTTGNTLWSRPLPAPIRSHGSDGSILFLGLADGRVFAFYSGGRGDVIARIDAAVEDVTPVGSGAGGGREGPAVLDADGYVHLLEGTRDRKEWRVAWSTDLGERYRGTRARFAEGSASDGIAVYAEGGPVTRVDLNGRLVWRREPGGEGVRNAAILDYGPDGTTTGYLFVVDTAGRGHLFAPDGTVESVLHLDGIPDRVVPFDDINRIFLGYPDWRYDILAIVADEDGDDSGASTGRRRIVSAAGAGDPPRTPTALRRYADAVLSGDSSRQRLDLLETIDDRITEGRLFGEVSTVREVLGEIALEAFSDPVLRGGIVQNDYPAVRREAVSLLGDLGDRSSRRILARVVRNDPDGTVVYAALAATARSGRDDASAGVYGFERFRRAREADRSLIAEGLVVCFEGTVPDQRETAIEERRRIATALAGANLPRPLRERAIRVVRGR